MEVLNLSAIEYGRHASISPSGSTSQTERALDEFMQQESRIKRLRARRMHSVQQSVESSVSPEATQRAEEWQTVSEAPERAKGAQEHCAGLLSYRRPRHQVLPNLRSNPFGKHDSYNSYPSIKDQFLFEWDEWDKKRALRLRKPKLRKARKRPLLKELPAITEHKVTAKLALKNFYLLKRKGFARIAKDIEGE